MSLNYYFVGQTSQLSLVVLGTKGLSNASVTTKELTAAGSHVQYVEPELGSVPLSRHLEALKAAYPSEIRRTPSGRACRPWREP